MSSISHERILPTLADEDNIRRLSLTQDVMMPVIADEEENSRQISSLSSLPSIGRQLTCLNVHDAWIAAARDCEEFAKLIPHRQLRREFSDPELHRLPQMPLFQNRQYSCPVTCTFETLGEISDCADEEASASEVSDENGINDSSILTQAIVAAVSRCNSSVAIALPGASRFLATSKQLAALTGLSHSELRELGISWISDAEALQHALQTGEDFSAVVRSIKKNGEYFQNFLHVRGLVLAENQAGETVWVVLMAFADVTNLDPRKLPSNHAIRLEKLASRAHKQILKHLSTNGLANIFDAEFAGREGMQFCPTVQWKFDAPMDRKPISAPQVTPSPDVNENDGNACVDTVCKGTTEFRSIWPMLIATVFAISVLLQRRWRRNGGSDSLFA